MIALSADTKNEAAFAIANGKLKDSSEAMYSGINRMIENAKKSSQEAKTTLQKGYMSALATSIVSITICVAAFLFAAVVVQRKIISPIVKSKKEIDDIINDIDERKGDLTKRITVQSDDEISALGMGINAGAASGDKPILALGADLSADQRATVLGLLGISESDLGDYDVISITNAEEHQYLDSYLSSSVIGTHALSSVLIRPADEGEGLNVTTYNISYCTIDMYTNALLTAGL